MEEIRQSRRQGADRWRAACQCSSRENSPNALGRNPGYYRRAAAQGHGNRFEPRLRGVGWDRGGGRARWAWGQAGRGPGGGGGGGGPELGLPTLGRQQDDREDEAESEQR